MEANRKSIAVVSAITLLLAVAAAQIPDVNNSNDTKYMYTFKTATGPETTLWGAKPRCRGDELRLLRRKAYPPNPPDMLQKFKDQLEEASPDDRDEYTRALIAKEFVNFAEVDKATACSEIIGPMFIKFFFKCGGKKRFEPYARFVEYYARLEFGPWAHKIIDDLNKDRDERTTAHLIVLNELFRAGLGLGSEPLSDEKMYDHVKIVDLATYPFDVAAMINSGKSQARSREPIPDSALENLISRLRRTLIMFGVYTMSDANIVNIARGVGAIKENELTYRYRLINEYDRLAAQVRTKEAYDLIKENLEERYKAIDR